MKKKDYEKPVVKKVAFDYRNQVVAASGCEKQWSADRGESSCTTSTSTWILPNA